MNLIIISPPTHKPIGMTEMHTSLRCFSSSLLKLFSNKAKNKLRTMKLPTTRAGMKIARQDSGVPCNSLRSIYSFKARIPRSLKVHDCQKGQPAHRSGQLWKKPWLFLDILTSCKLQSQISINLSYLQILSRTSLHMFHHLPLSSEPSYSPTEAQSTPRRGSWRSSWRSGRSRWSSICNQKSCHLENLNWLARKSMEKCLITHSDV